MVYLRRDIKQSKLGHGAHSQQPVVHNFKKLIENKAY